MQSKERTMQDGEPTYLLFALPPGGESAFGVSVGEADTLEAAAEVLEGVLKPGETGVAVRPGRNKPEAVWVRTAAGELRRGKVSALGRVPKAETDGHIDFSEAYEAQAEATRADALQEALRENLSPEAVAVIAAYLQTAAGEPLVGQQVEWFRKQCIELVGRAVYDQVCDSLGL